MPVLRIKLSQRQAHYGRPEGVDNRMTYPLPPFSTVIGALHAACGYREYHPMDISIQGSYQSMQKEIYTSNKLNNRREDDRGHLVYLQHPHLLSAGYELVAKALKNQGNSFRNNETIQILNRERMEEYWALLEKKDELDRYNEEVLKPKKQGWKEKEKSAKEKLKTLDKKSEEYRLLSEELKKWKAEFQQEEEAFKERRNLEYELPMSHYKTLTKAPKYAEVLYGVELVIHVQSEEPTIRDIEESIYNLRAIGRSEDYIDLEDCRRVELRRAEKEYRNQHCSGYLKKEHLMKKNVLLGASRKKVQGIPVRGTTYYLPKNYVLTPKGRSFEYYPVCYISGYSIDEKSEQVFIDNDGYIVDLI